MQNKKSVKKIVSMDMRRVSARGLGKTQVLKKRQQKKIIKRKGPQVSSRQIFAKRSVFSTIYRQRKVSVLAATFALFMAFVFGGWYALNTEQSVAEEPRILSAEASAEPIKIEGIIVRDLGSEAANNNALFNTPLSQLQSYFDSIKEPDIINQRKNLIEQMLKDMKSPIVPASETIAQQDHWKLILAIAFAESTMGKNCVDKNCSNIGVAPGHALWRKYETYSAWVLDFNRLLERRYKDWTLTEMCGVYVQPCNKNWLLATQQILDEIEERGIE